MKRPPIFHAIDPRHGPTWWPWCGQGGFSHNFARRWRNVTCQKCRRKGRPRRWRRYWGWR